MNDPLYPDLGGDYEHALGDILVAQVKRGDTRGLMKLITTVLLYGDPGFYHGATFEFKLPTGGFDNDFGPVEDYSSEKPGLLARSVVNEIIESAAK